MWPPMVRPLLSQKTSNFPAEVPGVGARLVKAALLKEAVTHDGAGVADDDVWPCVSWVLAAFCGPPWQMIALTLMSVGLSVRALAAEVARGPCPRPSCHPGVV